MLTKQEIKKTIQKALIFSLTVFIVAGAIAVIRSIVHKVHVMNPETADVQPNETYDEDELFIYGTDTLNYNTTLINNSNTDVYAFIEFCSPVVNGTTVLTPTLKSGWALYDEGSGTVEGQNVHKYIIAYSNGESMTRLASGVETGSVFQSIAVNGDLTEAQYKKLAENPFHVFVRAAVASASDGNIDTVWGQVEKD